MSVINEIHDKFRNILNDVIIKIINKVEDWVDFLIQEEYWNCRLSSTFHLLNMLILKCYNLHIAISKIMQITL